MNNLHQKWCKRTLTKEDVYKWIQKQYYTDYLTEEEKREVATHIHRIYRWRKGETEYIGTFLTAVLSDNLSRAVGAADKTNTKALHLYPTYLYNNVPGNWRQWIKEKGE